jgi:hypothetical protein
VWDWDFFLMDWRTEQRATDQPDYENDRQQREIMPSQWHWPPPVNRDSGSQSIQHPE